MKPNWERRVHCALYSKLYAGALLTIYGIIMYLNKLLPSTVIAAENSGEGLIFKLLSSERVQRL